MDNDFLTLWYATRVNNDVLGVKTINTSIAASASGGDKVKYVRYLANSYRTTMPATIAKKPSLRHRKTIEQISTETIHSKVGI